MFVTLTIISVSRLRFNQKKKENKHSAQTNCSKFLIRAETGITYLTNEAIIKSETRENENELALELHNSSMTKLGFYLELKRKEEKKKKETLHFQKNKKQNS